MKRINSLVVISIFSITCLFSSCKKGSGGNDGPPVDPVIDPSNSKSLSTALKVWHGERKTGAVTASTTANRPVIDPVHDGEQIHAIAGRYAIIQPTLQSGGLAGYYVEVPGAGDYFKIDFSKPRQVPRGTPLTSRGNSLVKNNIFAKGQDDTTGNGVLDSAIVISIPENIKPGTFCMNYYAVDSAGYISDPVEVCITVTSFGGDASVAFLAGDWRQTATQDAPGKPWVPEKYGWDVGMVTLFCNYEPSGNFYYFTETCVTQPCTSFTDTAYAFRYDKNDVTFSSNGAFKGEYKSYGIRFNTDSGPVCGELQLDTFWPDDVQYLISGGWSYNATTNKLTVIGEFYDWEPSLEFNELTLEKESDNQFVLRDSDGYAFQMTRL